MELTSYCKGLVEKCKMNALVDIIEIVEQEYGVKLTAGTRRWLREKWGRMNTSPRIEIRGKGYNKPITELLRHGIIEKTGIFPFNGYGESFSFTKKLFPERAKFTPGKFNEMMSDVAKNMDLL